MATSDIQFRLALPHDTHPNCVNIWNRYLLYIILNTIRTIRTLYQMKSIDRKYSIEISWFTWHYASDLLPLNVCIVSRSKYTHIPNTLFSFGKYLLKRKIFWFWLVFIVVHFLWTVTAAKCHLEFILSVGHIEPPRHQH